MECEPEPEPDKEEGHTAHEAEADIALSICCIDGTTIPIAAPRNTTILALKRLIAELRSVSCLTIDLFIKGTENKLPDSRDVSEFANVPLFALFRSDQRCSLEALFRSAGGECWRHRSGWMTDAPVEEWYGVGLSDEGHVERILLNNNNLVGHMPSEIGLLAHLKTLDLNSNRISGAIPAQLAEATGLRHLYLNNNDLSGPIPAELGQLTHLTHLRVEKNPHLASIPQELQGRLIEFMWDFPEEKNA